MIFKKISRKSRPGSVLLASLVVGSLVLGFVLQSSQLMVKDHNQRQSLVNSQRAYYGAESGMEKVLRDLNASDSTHYIDKDDDFNERVRLQTSLINRGKEYSLQFESGQSLIMPLWYKTSDETETAITNWEINTSDSPVKLQWRVSCTEAATTSEEDSSERQNFISLEGNITTAHWEAAENPGTLSQAVSTNLAAVIEGTVKSLSEFFAETKTPCYLSLKNETEGNLEITYSAVGDGEVVPPASEIEIKATAGNFTQKIHLERWRRIWKGAF